MLYVCISLCFLLNVFVLWNHFVPSTVTWIAIIRWRHYKRKNNCEFFTIFFDLVNYDKHPDQLVPVGLGILSCGPHTLIVLSSDTETNIWGWTGFQETQFTVRVWPWRTARGSSLRICQMYTYNEIKVRSVNI